MKSCALFPLPRGFLGRCLCPAQIPRGFHVEGAYYPYPYHYCSLYPYYCSLRPSASAESKLLLRISAGNDHEGGETSQHRWAESAIRGLGKSPRYRVHGVIYPATGGKFGGVF